VLTFSDRLVIGFTLGPAAAGIYAASYDLAFVIWQIVTPIRIALYPVISRLWDQGQHEEANQYLSRSIKMTVFLALPSAAGLSVLAPHLLQLLSNADFVQASYVIVPLVGIATILQGLSMFCSLILRLHKNTRSIAVALVVSASVHLALNFILIPTLGIIGGAISTILGYSLDLGLVSWLAWRTGPFALPWRPVLVFALAAIVMTPIVAWVGSGGGWVALFAAIALGGAVYLGVSVGLKGITVREMRILLNRPAATEAA
jgi:O-antigen/teichoic acid export membrane protein